MLFRFLLFHFIFSSVSVGRSQIYDVISPARMHYFSACSFVELRFQQVLLTKGTTIFQTRNRIDTESDFYEHIIKRLCLLCSAAQPFSMNIEHIQNMESERQSDRQKAATKTTAKGFMRSKAFEYALCVFVCKLQLPHIALFMDFFFVSGSSCGAVDATVEKGFFVLFCFGVHGLAAPFALLQFKLLTFASGLNSMNCCYFMCPDSKIFRHSCSATRICYALFFFRFRIGFSLTHLQRMQKAIGKSHIVFVCYIYSFSIRKHPSPSERRTHHINEFI